MSYDSTADTLKHSRRVGELIHQLVKELLDRAVSHDLSKTEDPELAVFNEFTPKLKGSTYGSDEYKGYLEAMGEGLRHHYAANRHHPEHFGSAGVTGMTLVDLVEMLADWKAATERHDTGSLSKSLRIQRERFEIDDQLACVLFNTARGFGWLDELTWNGDNTREAMAFLKPLGVTFWGEGANLVLSVQGRQLSIPPRQAITRAEVEDFVAGKL